MPEFGSTEMSSILMRRLWKVVLFVPFGDHAFDAELKRKFAQTRTRNALPSLPSIVILPVPGCGTREIICGWQQRNILIGENALLYAGIYILRPVASGAVIIGNGAVIARGVHIVAMSGITIVVPVV
jgi:acetyltransferase-like isoleucine patch superfamily enzyme